MTCTVVFPDWVNSPPDQAPSELAQKRLRYLVRRAALEVAANGSVQSLSSMCGLHRSTFSNFMSAGAFSAATATKLESVCGRELLRHEWLMNPLDC